ncbi:MAG: hypothetical protein KKC76_01775 [Proteobacteria bacterium]|nr:hypothetical protein [Pseudomonadota bacterium]MBU4294882.1 hypothetical protein [Pseudomonadota bacterium]MCG2750115.1 hypothetical protein [Desulfobulbaceae bacterium]
MNVESGGTTWSKQETEECVKIARLSLYNRNLPCGPKAILGLMKDENIVTPLPAEKTVARILARHGLTHQRTGFYDGDMD